MNTETAKTEIVDSFIIEMTLISPISDIVTKLNNGNFRDCDIKWLDSKLEKFMKIACDTMGMSAIVPSQMESEPFKVLNKHNIDRYLKYFNGLLDYFKGFK